MTPSRLLASGFCSGFAPVAPGTAGSLVGIILGAALLHVSPWALLAGTALATIGGVYATMRATGLPLRSHNKTAMDDPGWVVIDEIAGQFCALLLLPRPSWAGAALAFAAFRALDITKPASSASWPTISSPASPPRRSSASHTVWRGGGYERPSLPFPPIPATE
jgi:phosphatidylglycerophosphatase A